MTTPTARDCIEWSGPLSADGYGRAYLPDTGRTGWAHRVAWEAQHGPIPDGLVIDHLCRNRRCVNTDHMEVVTNRENVLRGIGPSALNARKEDCVNSHPLPEAAPNGRRDCPVCLSEKWDRQNKRRWERERAAATGARLTEASVKEARSLAASGAPQREIACRFGVTQSAIRQAVNRKTWRSVA